MKLKIAAAATAALLTLSTALPPMTGADEPTWGGHTYEQWVEIGELVAQEQSRILASIDWDALGRYLDSLAARSGPSEAQWAALRQCEATGSYTAVSPSGRYRGAYQFDLATWQSVGGSGDPAAASPAEQDARALALWESRGWQPWPVCGRIAAGT